MTTFDDREHAFEAHFAFEQELDFKAQARRDHLLALWAAEKMGLSSSAQEDYALSLLRADLREPGDEDVHHKLVADFAAKGVDILPSAVRAQMDLLLAQARRELGAG